MRLRQEFRTRQRTMVARRAAVVEAWALAAAAILVGAISTWNWQRARHDVATKQEVAVPSAAARTPPPASENVSASAKENEPPAPQKKSFQNERRAAASADDTGQFTLLPGSLPADTDAATLVRVRSQRGPLGALAVPVNAERADV